MRSGGDRCGQKHAGYKELHLQRRVYPRDLLRSGMSLPFQFWKNLNGFRHVLSRNPGTTQKPTSKVDDYLSVSQIAWTSRL